jgi:hypothetical protein
MATLADTRSASCPGSALILRIATAVILLMKFNQPAFGDGPITVVVLPPVQSTMPEGTVAAAELFCDQLAEELAKDATLRVVDRTQIDRVLMERASGTVAKPALAYDALVRVNIDPLLANPAVVLPVVDLSTGNLSEAHEWPRTTEVPSGQLREMAQTCRDPLNQAVSVSQGQTPFAFSFGE